MENLFGYGQFDFAKGAVDFLEREKITGTMFNTYGIGGYLLYRGYPDRKVFIDGRNVDYGLDFMARTYAGGVDADRWKALEDEYNLTYAVVDYDAIRTLESLPYSQILDVDQWETRRRYPEVRPDESPHPDASPCPVPRVIGPLLKTSLMAQNERDAPLPFRVVYFQEIVAHKMMPPITISP